MYGFIQRGNTRIEYYQEVAVKGTKKGKCGCGKMRTRTMTFSQTLNPFNKNKEKRKLYDHLPSPHHRPPPQPSEPRVYKSCAGEGAE